MNPALFGFPEHSNGEMLQELLINACSLPR